MPNVSRRALILGSGAAALGLAACSNDSPAPAASTTPADVDSTRHEVATSEQALIDLYAAAIATNPTVADQLQVIADQHADHLAALGVAAQPASPAPTAGTSLADLRDAERQAARQRRTACVASSDGELARTLALIAASEASHVAALKELAS